MSRYWSKNVTKLTPYVPGEQPRMDDLVKLNTNENPYPPSPEVIEAICNATNEQLRRYPDPTALALREAIANNFDLAANQISVGNSSDEVLAHIFQALLKHDQPILFPDITYGFYPVFCRLFEIDYQTVALQDDFIINLQDYQQPNGGIIFANPNAPTGLALDLTELEELLQRNTESVVVVDEAYVDFGAQSAVTLVDRYENLVVTQTLSKSRSLAGLRVGFAMANQNLIQAIERVKNSFHPYALDSLALAGAQASIKDQTYFEQCCQQIISTRTQTIAALIDLGFEVLPSQANFLFAKHDQIAGEELFNKLRRRAIVTRYFDKPRLADYIRISIGTDQEMEQLLDAIKEIVPK